VADVLIAPYLPLAEPGSVADWMLLPILGADQADTVENEAELIPNGLRRPVRRLVDAYRVRDDPGVGVLIAPPKGRIGAPFEREAMRPLSRALLAGAVSANPKLRETEDGSLGGWSIVTAENARLYGHPVTDGDSYALEIGVIVQVLSARSAEGDEPLPKVSPPVELPVPMISRYDIEVASATLAALTNMEAPARRLLRALDWYTVVLSNAEAITIDVRVGAARSALEVLVDGSDETRKLVRAYGRLVRGETNSEETYDDVFWARGPGRLTPDEWWLTRLCELRNAIVHGDEVPSELWEHEGSHQLNHIHDRLIDAIRIAVADAVNDPALKLPLEDRSLERALDQFLLAQREDANRDGDE
jgi:hypothetical protein